MKRNFALVLTALMLVFSLTACGGRSNSNTTGDNGSTATEDDSNTNSGSTNNGGSNADRNEGALGGAADDAVNGMENAVDDVLPGDDNTQPNQGGVTYGDMLENGTVEDAPTPSDTANSRSR